MPLTPQDIPNVLADTTDYGNVAFLATPQTRTVPVAVAGREVDAQALLLAYPVLDDCLVWATQSLGAIDGHAPDGDRVAAQILTLALRVTASAALPQTGLTYGAILMLARVRQVLYDTRQILYTHAATAVGLVQPGLSTAARVAQQRLRTIDPIYAMAYSTPPLADLAILLREATWPTTS